MCGICGYWDLNLKLGANTSIVELMASKINHRGPDGQGTWHDLSSGVAFGHRRLSIVDLSSAGDQPMTSHSGRHTIVFNGEIYNHVAIRNELNASLGDKIIWKGYSDTETLLISIEQWGIEKALTRCVGMFAFALWDNLDGTLHIARDRFGEKPLYYGFQGKTFLFGSELKALRAHPFFQAEINRKALGLFLRYNYVPAPHCIYKGIHKLPPGSYMRVTKQDFSRNAESPLLYWSIEDAVRKGKNEPFVGCDKECVDQLEGKLQNSISMQMESEVPLGAFLSGGVDSSAIVALMQSQSAIPIRTFTIGFHEKAFNEATHAKAVASHLGTDHTEMYVKAEDALKVIPKLPDLYDEPFSDSSQIPTFLVAEMTRKHVTVSLSGDAGDEVFGGYNRYLFVKRLWSVLEKLPHHLRGCLASLMASVPISLWDKLYSIFRPFLPPRSQFALPGDKIHKLSEIIGLNGPETIYQTLISNWKKPEELVIGIDSSSSNITPKKEWGLHENIENAMMALDTTNYLPDDILTKVDRAAMGVSLETRIPFLDHRVVEFAWSLPLEMKVREGQGKWILRQVLYKYVPKELIERPKMGFGMPIGDWLRGPLREWAESLLDDSRLRSEGFFNPAPIRKKWSEHLSGKRNWQYLLWNVLMFQAWLENEKVCA